MATMLEDGSASGRRMSGFSLSNALLSLLDTECLQDAICGTSEDSASWELSYFC